ncbi:MAG: HNH endonuclease [Chitinophagaceae bacterium]|nr:HNH endonuclease [Chitinophagaceae bacterium]
MKKRITIPNKTKALLQQEIDSKCPVCDSLDVDHFELHHMDENPENNEQANLLMLCPICHSRITKGDISPQEVAAIKQTITLKAKLRRSPQAAKIIKINGSVNNSTIANNIQASRIIINGKKPKLSYAENAIGNDAFKKIMSTI